MSVSVERTLVCGRRRQRYHTATRHTSLTNKYDSGVNLYLEKQQDNITAGHSLKLVNNRYHYDLRKFSFAPRIVNVLYLIVNVLYII